MNSKSLQYSVIRKPRRRTASITVSRNNQISVVVPAWISSRQIEDLVQKKYSWIQKRIRLNAEFEARCLKRQYHAGESFYFLGRPHILTFASNQDETVSREGDYLIVSGGEPAQIKKMLKAWYIRELEIILGQRIPFFEKLLNVQAREVKIKSLESQWGNCRTGEILTFNWKMVMAPQEIIDYIIVHELAHLIHLNHSRNFWQRVQSVYPSYQDARSWLRKNGDLLDF